MIILASNSPRRKELLKYVCPEFKIIPANIEENLDTKLPLTKSVEKLAQKKAQFLLDEYPEDVVVGADTVVVLNNKVYGKPKDKDEAKHMLAELSGNTHHVISGICILSKEKDVSFNQITEVTFYPLTAEDIEEYVEKYNPLDKAGAYGIQDGGALLVESINGDYYNVMGLPIALLHKKLKNYNFI